MPANDREVFDRLTENETEAPVNFITYAIFAFQRREWVNHHTQLNKRSPEQDEIDGWIANLTDYDFEQMRNRALSFFGEAARGYMASDLAAAKQEALREALIREVQSATELQKTQLSSAVDSVKAAGSFWTQLGIALSAAIVAPLIIGAVIVAALVFSDRFPSFRDIANRAASGVVDNKSQDQKALDPSKQ